MTPDSAIFLRQGKDLVALRETSYEEEAVLQEALELFPDLIAGVTTGGEGGQLLLVRREMGVPGADGPTRLSLDHLFLDSAGVPVLVEVKRSSDTRARREVVAQMLDYAANGVAYWPVDDLRAAVTAQAVAKEKDVDALLADELGVGDTADFWQRVEDNLRRGRVRLIFLADRLTPELTRIIEFLNEQMQHTEVLGVELPQYTDGKGVVAYVPRLVGDTAQAEQAKEPTTSRERWTRESFLARAAEVCSPEEQALVQTLLEHREAHPGRWSWGNGVTAGVTGWYVVKDRDTPVWNVNLGAGPGKATLAFVLTEYASRHVDLVPKFAAAVRALPALAAAVDKSEQSGWKSWAYVPLPTAASHSEAVQAAVAAALASTPTTA